MFGRQLHGRFWAQKDEQEMCLSALLNFLRLLCGVPETLVENLWLWPRCLAVRIKLCVRSSLPSVVLQRLVPVVAGGDILATCLSSLRATLSISPTSGPYSPSVLYPNPAPATTHGQNSLSRFRPAAHSSCVHGTCVSWPQLLPGSWPGRELTFAWWVSQGFPSVCLCVLVGGWDR